MEHTHWLGYQGNNTALPVQELQQPKVERCDEMMEDAWRRQQAARVESWRDNDEVAIVMVDVRRREQAVRVETWRQEDEVIELIENMRRRQKVAWMER